MRTAPVHDSVTLVPATALFPGGKPIDLISLADVVLELNLDDVGLNPWLQKKITGLSATANAYCDRVLVAQTYRETVLPFIDAVPWQSPTHGDVIQLKNWPIANTPSPAMAPPPSAPLLSAQLGVVAALAARKYYARATYVTPYGETAAGPETTFALAGGSLATVFAPGPDRMGQATGWNLYAATASGVETLQNASPMALNASWLEPATGLTTGAAMPNYLLAVESAGANPYPLCEGVDFTADHRGGQLTRLFTHGRRADWGVPPYQIVYTAGFTASTVPPDLADALILLVKARYYARFRDSAIRQENIAGISETTYWFGQGPGAETDFPPDVQAKLDRYRQTVIA